MLRSAESGVGLSFQKIVPDWSIRRRIGSGGSSGLSGGLIDRCGRSMLIGYDGIGAVIMKITNSTSIPSASGQMFMSDSAPPSEFEEKAMAQCPPPFVSLVATKTTLCISLVYACYTLMAAWRE